MSYNNTTANVISAGLGFVPVLGSVKSLVECISGNDMITGATLSSQERSLSAIGAIPAFQGVKYLAKATKYGSKFYKGVETVDTLNNAYNLGKSMK